MGRMSWRTYADALQVTVDFVQHVYDAYYHDKDQRPNLERLRIMFEYLRHDTSAGQHQEIYQQLRQLAHAIVILGQNHERRTGSITRRLTSIISGDTSPQSIIDVYRAAGVYLLDNQEHPLRTKPGDLQNPLGDVHPDDLVENISTTSNLLHQATNARPSSKDMWSFEALKDEIESQTQAQFPEVQAELSQVGRNWQRLADLITEIYKNSDARVIEENNSKGKRLEKHLIEPESPLELFRFIYGHFGIGL